MWKENKSVSHNHPPVSSAVLQNFKAPTRAPTIPTSAQLCTPRSLLPPLIVRLGTMWGQQCLRIVAAWYVFDHRVEKPQVTSAWIASW